MSRCFDYAATPAFAAAGRIRFRAAMMPLMSFRYVAAVITPAFSFSAHTRCAVVFFAVIADALPADAHATLMPFHYCRYAILRR